MSGKKKPPDTIPVRRFADNYGGHRSRTGKPMSSRSGCLPPLMIVLTAQIIGAASQLTTHRARKTTLRIDLLAPRHARTNGFDSSSAHRSLFQRTLTRLGIGLATVWVRLHRQRTHRRLFRIHCLSRKPTHFSIGSHRLQRSAILHGVHRAVAIRNRIALKSRAVKTMGKCPWMTVG